MLNILDKKTPLCYIWKDIFKTPKCIVSFIDAYQRKGIWIMDAVNDKKSQTKLRCELFIKQSNQKGFLFVIVFYALEK